MKVILLTAIVFTVALVCRGQGVFSNGNNMTSNLAAPPKLEPCKETSTDNAYKTFVHRHILKKNFDRNSLDAWKRYLEDSKLCGRTPLQSFIDADEKQVRNICTAVGRLIKGATADQGDSCISKSGMDIYEVKSEESNKVCKVKSANHRKQNVIVKCNKVKKACRPVHFVNYINQQPDMANPCVEG